jgi:hypothetical protein
MLGPDRPKSVMVFKVIEEDQSHSPLCRTCTTR